MILNLKIELIFKIETSCFISLCSELNALDERFRLWARAPQKFRLYLLAGRIRVLIGFYSLIDLPQHCDMAALKQQATCTKSLYCIHIVAYEKDSSALSAADVLHLSQTLLLKINISHCENLINDEYLRL